MEKLSCLLLATLLMACSNPSPPATTPTPGSPTVQKGEAATANVTREQHAPSVEQQAMLKKIEGTLKDETAEAYHERGILYVMAAEQGGISAGYNAAVEDFTRCLELDPNMAGGYSNRAMANIRIGNIEPGLADLDKLIELKPEESYGYMVKATVLAKLERNEEALANYDKALDLGDPDAAFNRGNLHLRMGDKEKARQDYERALKTSKNPQVLRGAKMNLEALKE